MFLKTLVYISFVIFVIKKRAAENVLQCSDSSMTFALARDDYLYTYVNGTLNDASCTSVSNASHVTITTQFDACGCEVIEKNDTIIYRNNATFYMTNYRSEAISRGQSYEFVLTCEKSRYVDVSSSSVAVSKSVITSEESGYGSFSIGFAMFKDENFNEMHTEYPMDVQLTDQLYVQMNLTSNTPGVKLVVQRCYATPTSDPQHNIYHDIVKNRCISDETAEMILNDDTSFHVSVAVFSFLDATDNSIFIHCESILCMNSSQDSRCSYSCDNRRKRREVTKPSHTYTVSSNEIRIDLEDHRKEEEMDENVRFLNTPAGIILVVVSILAIGAICVILYAFKRKNRDNAVRSIEGDLNKGYDQS